MKKCNNYRQGKQRTACWHGFSFSIRLRTPYTQAPWERHWWRTLTNTWNWRGACVLGQQLTLKSTHWTQGPLPAIRTSGNTGPRTRILLPSCSLHSEAEVLTSPACSIYFTLSCVTLLKGWRLPFMWQKSKTVRKHESEATRGWESNSGWWLHGAGTNFLVEWNYSICWWWHNMYIKIWNYKPENGEFWHVQLILLDPLFKSTSHY